MEEKKLVKLLRKKIAIYERITAEITTIDTKLMEEFDKELKQLEGIDKQLKNDSEVATDNLFSLKL